METKPGDKVQNGANHSTKATRALFRLPYGAVRQGFSAVCATVRHNTCSLKTVCFSGCLPTDDNGGESGRRGDVVHIVRLRMALVKGQIGEVFYQYRRTAAGGVVPDFENYVLQRGTVDIEKYGLVKPQRFSAVQVKLENFAFAVVAVTIDFTVVQFVGKVHVGVLDGEVSGCLKARAS